MLLQKQPNRWSCFLTAFAILIEKPVTELTKMLGHDGSEVLNENAPEPFCRRGFTIYEILNNILIPLGYYVDHFNYEDQEYEYFTIPGLPYSIEHIFPRAVVCGHAFNKGHALAHANNMWVDPSTGSVTSVTSNFKITDVFRLDTR